MISAIGLNSTKYPRAVARSSSRENGYVKNLVYHRHIVWFRAFNDVETA
jgi:hypothetical protein